MAVYGYAITTAGSNLLGKLLATGGTLNLTRVQFGSGKASATDAAGLVSQAALMTPIGDGLKSAPIFADGKMLITIQYNNSMNGGITSNTNINEFGIFATDPDLGEILFLYGSLGDTPDVLLPYNGSTAITRKYQLSIGIGSVAGVATNFDSVGGYVVTGTAPLDTSIIWIDSAHGYIGKFYDGTKWVPISTAVPVVASDPTAPENGQVWVNSSGT